MAKKVPKIVKEIRETGDIKIDYSYQKNISYSQLSMFHQCPRKWSLMYKDGHKKYEPSIHFVFGTAMHEVIQEWLDQMYSVSIKSANELPLEDMLKEKMKTEYMTALKKNSNKHFSSPGDLTEFYNDGVKILNFLVKKRKDYFGKKGVHLVGCEVPINVSMRKYINNPNLIFKGYIDVLIFDEWDDTFKIIDLKTSTRGWNKDKKKDNVAKSQLLLYKQFLSTTYDIPLESIKVEYLILKRKIYEEGEFLEKSIQRFEPADGKVSINRSNKLLKEFLEECFDKKGHKDKTHRANPTAFGCKFCPFSGNKDLCEWGIS